LPERKLIGAFVEWPKRAGETAMHEGQDIVLVVDYHARNIEFRWFNRQTSEERTGKFATNRSGILRQAEQAAE